ncbi:unnamed protein product [Jaminaea pallidilutea]
MACVQCPSISPCVNCSKGQVCHQIFRSSGDCQTCPTNVCAADPNAAGGSGSNVASTVAPVVATIGVILIALVFTYIWWKRRKNRRIQRVRAAAEARARQAKANGINNGRESTTESASSSQADSSHLRRRSTAAATHLSRITEGAEEEDEDELVEVMATSSAVPPHRQPHTIDIPEQAHRSAGSPLVASASAPRRPLRDVDLNLKLSDSAGKQKAAAPGSPTSIAYLQAPSNARPRSAASFATTATGASDLEYVLSAPQIITVRAPPSGSSPGLHKAQLVRSLSDIRRQARGSPASENPFADASEPSTSLVPALPNDPFADPQQGHANRRDTAATYSSTSTGGYTIPILGLSPVDVSHGPSIAPQSAQLSPSDVSLFEEDGFIGDRSLDRRSMASTIPDRPPSHWAGSPSTIRTAKSAKGKALPVSPLRQASGGTNSPRMTAGSIAGLSVLDGFDFNVPGPSSSSGSGGG